MTKKIDTYESFDVGNVKIHIDDFLYILENTGEDTITLECGDTVYESLEEIKSHKYAIDIPFEVRCAEVRISFDLWGVRVSGSSKSSHRKRAISNELGEFIPFLSKRPFLFYFLFIILLMPCGTVSRTKA